ncbi:hypothetical protein MBLNU13_g04903t1 [Cladosporium sp. NU13]
MFLATTGLVWAISAGVGPLLGGVFTQYLSWRWVFWVNLPSCFAAFVVLCFFLGTAHRQAPSRTESRRMDWVGTATIVSTTVLTLLSLDFGGVVFPWNSPKVLSILVSGVVLCAVFILWEAKGATDPLIPARILNSIPKAGPLFVCFTHGIVNVSSWYFLPLYFQAVRGASPVRSGLLLMPIVVVQALVGVIVGGIIYRYNCIQFIIWMGMVFSTLGFGLFITFGATTSLPSLVAIEVMAAIGIGAVFQAPLIAYQAAVDPADMAIATALFGFVRSLSTSISVVVGGVVFQNAIRDRSSELSAVLGDAALAENFSAANATSSVLLVQTLPLVQQDAVKGAYVAGLREMWKMYTVIAGCGLMAALLLKRQSLGTPERGEASTGTDAGAGAGGEGVELSRR